MTPQAIAELEKEVRLKVEREARETYEKEKQDLMAKFEAERSALTSELSMANTTTEDERYAWIGFIVGGWMGWCLRA